MTSLSRSTRRQRLAHSELQLRKCIEPTAVNSNGAQYGTADHPGTSRVITNSSGSVVSRHDYMPFGEELGAGTYAGVLSLGRSGRESKLRLTN